MRIFFISPFPQILNGSTITTFLDNTSLYVCSFVWFVQYEREEPMGVRRSKLKRNYCFIDQRPISKTVESTINMSRN